MELQDLLKYVSFENLVLYQYVYLL